MYQIYTLLQLCEEISWLSPCACQVDGWSSLATEGPSPPSWRQRAHCHSPQGRGKSYHCDPGYTNVWKHEEYVIWAFLFFRNLFTLQQPRVYSLSPPWA